MNIWALRALKLLKIALINEDIFNINKHTKHIKASAHTIKDEDIKKDDVLQNILGNKKVDNKPA